MFGSVSTASRSSSASAIDAIFEQSRASDHQSTSGATVHTVFTVAGAMAYELSGTYSNSLGFTDFQASLLDVTTNSYLFQYAFANASESEAVEAEMGTSVGNWFGGNGVAGSMSGMLMDGHQYEWTVQTGSQAYANTLGAEAAGSARIQFADIAVVPEPTSIAVWSCLGLAAVGGAWRRQRRTTITV